MQELSTALTDLVTTHGMQLLQYQVLRQTVLASLMAALSPVLLLQITKVIGVYKPIYTQCF